MSWKNGRIGGTATRWRRLRSGKRWPRQRMSTPRRRRKTRGSRAGLKACCSGLQSQSRQRRVVISCLCCTDWRLHLSSRRLKLLSCAGACSTHGGTISGRRRVWSPGRTAPPAVSSGLERCAKSSSCPSGCNTSWLRSKVLPWRLLRLLRHVWPRLRPRRRSSASDCALSRRRPSARLLPALMCSEATSRLRRERANTVRNTCQQPPRRAGQLSPHGAAKSSPWHCRKPSNTSSKGLALGQPATRKVQSTAETMSDRSCELV
mmetsp:Transcript_20313/g.47522  ORF Transcript_20313/g.47522 Transcript_20313/m.47522 type:complete len:262 (+) Transcript_20313:87-872(+)